MINLSNLIEENMPTNKPKNPVTIISSQKNLSNEYVFLTPSNEFITTEMHDAKGENMISFIMKKTDAIEFARGLYRAAGGK
jgi:hypothetical protein